MKTCTLWGRLLYFPAIILSTFGGISNLAVLSSELDRLATTLPFALSSIVSGLLFTFYNELKYSEREKSHLYFCKEFAYLIRQIDAMLVFHSCNIPTHWGSLHAFYVDLISKMQHLDDTSPHIKMDKIQDPRHYDHYDPYTFSVRVPAMAGNEVIWAEPTSQV